MNAHSSRLLDQLEDVLEGLETLLKSTAGAATGKADEIASRVQSGVTQARDELRDLKDRVHEEVAQGTSSVDRFVRENPWTAVGIAAALALFVGALLSPRGSGRSRP